MPTGPLFIFIFSPFFPRCCTLNKCPLSCSFDIGDMLVCGCIMGERRGALLVFAGEGEKKGTVAVMRQGEDSMMQKAFEPQP